MPFKLNAPSKTKRVTADCADFTAEIRETSTGMCVVDVQLKNRGEGGNTPVKKERTTGHDLWNEARKKQQKQQDAFTITCGSIEQAKRALAEKTKFQIVYTEEKQPWGSGLPAGKSVEEARAEMQRDVARKKQAQPPSGIVLTDAEKAEIRKSRAVQFMDKHSEFVSSAFNWERMIKCAIDAGFISSYLEPATVEQWEACYEYLLERGMIIQVEGQSTPVTPYRYEVAKPVDPVRRVTREQARQQLRNVSTDDLEAQERQRQEARRAERKGSQPAAESESPAAVSLADAKKLSDDQLRQIEQNRQTRRRVSA